MCVTSAHQGGLGTYYWENSSTPLMNTDWVSKNKGRPWLWSKKKRPCKPCLICFKYVTAPGRDAPFPPSYTFLPWNTKQHACTPTLQYVGGDDHKLHPFMQFTSCYMLPFPMSPSRRLYRNMRLLERRANLRWSMTRLKLSTSPCPHTPPLIKANFPIRW